MKFSLALVAGAAAHMSLILPPSRNAVDNILPPWSGGKFGKNDTDPDKYGCDCYNSTSICNVAQSCFWFSNGCSIGCKTCDGTGTTNPNTRDRCNSGKKATVNDPYRTFNLNTVVGSDLDIYKHNPWRSPGSAPVYDSCGMAGGEPKRGGGQAKYTNTTLAKQGDLGSEVLPPAPTGIVWKAGSEVETKWSIRANHGGGYQYRLCPASEKLTEECFFKTPVPFAKKTFIQFPNSTRLDIGKFMMFASEGTMPLNSTWARNPIPYSNMGAAPEFEPPCAESKLNNRTGIPTSPVGDCSGQQPHNTTIVDTLVVPQVPDGDYVLSLRYDCEKSAQIWTNCADISVAA